MSVVRELVHLVSFKVNEASIAAIEARTASLSKSMNRAFSAAIAGVAVFGIAEFGKHVLTVGNSLEQMGITIRNFAENSEQAKTAMDGIVQVATAMPTVQLSEISEPISLLLARGEKVKDVVDTFRNFQTVVGATGGSFSKLSNAFAETLMIGHLRQKEFNQYSLGGKAPLADMLEASLHISKEKIMEMIHTGKISAQMVRDSFANAAKEGSKYYNIMLDKAHTLWGMWKVFADKLDTYLAYGEKSIYSKMQMPLKEVLKTLGSMVDVLRNLDASWSRMIVIVGGLSAVAGVIGVLAITLGQAVLPLLLVEAAIVGIAAVIESFYVWKHGGKSLMGRLFGDYKEYQPTLHAIKTEIKELLPDLKLLMKDMLKVFKLFVSGPDGKNSALRDFLLFVRATVREIKDMADSLHWLFGKEKENVSSSGLGKGTADTAKEALKEEFWNVTTRQSEFAKQQHGGKDPVIEHLKSGWEWLKDNLPKKEDWIAPDSKEKLHSLFYGSRQNSGSVVVNNHIKIDASRATDAKGVGEAVSKAFMDAHMDMIGRTMIINNGSTGVLR